MNRKRKKKKNNRKEKRRSLYFLHIKPKYTKHSYFVLQYFFIHNFIFLQERMKGKINQKERDEVLITQSITYTQTIE
jgi:hypothetical protein